MNKLQRFNCRKSNWVNRNQQWPITLFLVLFCMPILFGQQILKSKKISYSHPELATTFNAYEVHELKMTELVSLTNGADQEELLFNLDLGNKNWQLNLVSNPLITPELKTTVLTDRGVEYRDINRTHTYKGYVNGDPDSKVRMSIYDDRIIGMVKTNGEEYFIEQLATLLADNRVNANRYVLYNVKDVVPDPSIKCGSVEAHSKSGHQHDLRTNQSGGGSSESILMACMEVDFALAAANDMVVKFGNVADVQTHILDITNMMEALYDDFMLDYIVTEIVIAATLAADPWTKSQFMDELLDETDPPSDGLPGFEPWAATGFLNPHDIGQLWVDRDVISDVTGSGLVGRAGGLGVVCTPQQYNVCEDYSTNMNSLRVLSAHENGHLWNGEHGLSNSGVTIMSPTITTAATDWSAANITQMQTHIDSRTCLAACGCDIMITSSASTDLTCSEADDGTITVVATSFEPITYSIAGPDGATPVVTNTTGTFTGLAAGNYIVRAALTADPSCTEVIDVDIMDGPSLVVDCSNIQDQNHACREDLPPVNFNLPIIIDSCGDVTRSTTTSNSDNTGCPGDPAIISRTYFIQDAAGNMAECIQTFTVESTNGPTITFCPASIIVSCGSDISTATLGEATATQECNFIAPVAVASADVSTPGGCAAESMIQRTFTATDACGRTTTCVQNITVVDAAPPVLTLPANVIAECDADYTATAGGAGVATAVDNCGGTVTIIPADVIVPGGTCPQVFMIQRTWTATDECGRSIQGVQMISLLDSDAPIITCPPNMTISCEEDRTIGALGTATATDNCDTDVMITFSDVFVAGACPQAGVLTRTWTATDDCGLFATCDQIIMITDDIDPIIVTCPSDMNIECDQPTTPDFTGRPVAVDNCDLEVASSFTDVNTPGVCDQEMTITRTWVVTDDCGNTASCVQTLNITDETAPIITCPESIIVECDEDTTPVTGVTGVATAVDNCDLAPVITSSDFIIPGDCVNEFTIERTWVATDNCGNTSNCTQTIFVQDTTDPVITCPADVTIECDVDRTPATNGTATATDNCTADEDIIITFADVIIPGPCANTFTIERTWTATDECELFSTCLQTINVEDTTPPVALAPPANLTVQCPDEIPNAIPLTAVDNCAGPITVFPTFAITNRECSTRYTFTYTWTFDDGCGNVTAISQDIQVIDTAPLLITSSPPDQMVSCQVNVITQENLVEVNAPCEGPVTITSSVSDPIGVLGCNGTRYIVTYTASDDCGRVAVATQTYTIQNDGPEILCGNEICYLPCGVTGEELLTTFNEFAERAVVVDACEESLFTVTNNFNPNSLADCGEVRVVTFTATDACGRSGSCTVPVIVVDDLAPTVSGPVIPAIRECDDIAGLQYISWINNTIADLNAIDNCGEVSVSYEPLMPNTTFEDGFPYARTEVTFTFSDECGNDLLVPGLFKLKNNHPPTFIGELEDQMITCPATPQFDTPVFIHGCGGATLTSSDENSGGSCPGGYTVTRTWTVTDGTGAASTIQQTIFVMGSNTQMSTVAGLIITEMDEPVEAVAIALNYSGTNFAQEEMTAEDGLYNFVTPANNDYQIQPSRNDEPLNGVTTYDLILLGQYILDIQQLNSPYQMIAADVNRSGNISSLDMIELRRLILVIDEEFTNNTSWRFVDAAYEFTNGSNPFLETFPETSTINDLANELSADFIAVKIGDLNNSAQPNQLVSGDTRSKDSDLVFHLEDQLVDAGEIFSVSFDATDFEQILGYQFTLKYNTDQVTFEDMEANELRSLNAENFGVKADQGVITTSWNREVPLTLTKGSTAFTLTFTAKEQVRISEVIGLYDAYTPAEAYNTTNDLMDVQLSFGEVAMDEKSVFRLFQNQPNPFRTETKIGFQLPEDGTATLVIYDIAGRVLRRTTKDYAAGYNEEVIEQSDLNASGILIYRLETDHGVATKKMILK